VKTVLIIDTDLRFAFWLGRGLDQAGYLALPASNVTSAKRLVAEMSATVDLVVISAAMPDSDSFLADLSRARSGLTVIAVLDEPGPNRIVLPKADLLEYKPVDLSEDAKREWVGVVELALAARGLDVDPRLRFIRQ
jgi:DNA-binding NtrC family response regulator